MSPQPRSSPTPALARRLPGGTSEAVVVTHALRTPIGKFMGAFAELSAADLGTSVVRDLLARARLDPARVGELVFGNARQAGGGPNVARQISVRAGIPESVPAWTVNMACGSGLKALAQVTDSILLGRIDIGIAGGVESMSGLPFFLPRMRAGYRLGHAPLSGAMTPSIVTCSGKCSTDPTFSAWRQALVTSAPPPD
jgi:acetyl-CoA C-acetyltransferase